jgi:hypothetical protein
MKPTSKALGRALQRAGHNRPGNTAAHHIVAKKADAADPARKVLEKFGIWLDDAANRGVPAHFKVRYCRVSRELAWEYLL